MKPLWLYCLVTYLLFWMIFMKVFVALVGLFVCHQSVAAQNACSAASVWQTQLIASSQSVSQQLKLRVFGGHLDGSCAKSRQFFSFSGSQISISVLLRALHCALGVNSMVPFCSVPAKYLITPSMYNSNRRSYFIQKRFFFKSRPSRMGLPGSTHAYLNSARVESTALSTRSFRSHMGSVSRATRLIPSLRMSPQKLIPSKKGCAFSARMPPVPGAPRRALGSSTISLSIRSRHTG